MRPALFAMAILGCTSDEPKEFGSDTSNSVIYAQSAYFSDLIVDIDGIGESFGDGHIRWRNVTPAAGEECQSSTGLAFLPLSSGASGQLYFPGDEVSSGSVSTLPLAPYAEHLVPVTLPHWNGVSQTMTFSGGEIRYEHATGTDLHVFTIEDSDLCEAPEGNPSDIVFHNPQKNCEVKAA